MNILLLEDDQSFGYILKAYLELNGINVTWAKRGQEALNMVEKYQFSLCVLDIMLPDIDGFQVAQKMKEFQDDLPFIFLSAKTLKVDKLRGYRLGSEDFITKPVDEEILLAKIQAILNRTNQATPFSKKGKVYDLGRFKFNFSRQILKYKSSNQRLTKKEADLLKLFCENKNQLVPREKALKHLWGKNDEFNRRSMDVFVFKLRQYLKPDENVRITNIHGRGFVLEV